MKAFMGKDFLLNTESAKMLYHNHAAKMPLCDYHCHVVVQEIFEDKKYKNLTEVWLSGDHYKWRCMRLNGVDERYITGDASDYEKFLAYAKTIQMAIGNPLYHWTHLELQRYFDINIPLNEDTAEVIWEKANEVLANGLTTREMIRLANVKTLCSTDDPADDLIWHKKIKEDETFDVKVLPSFRPDQALALRDAGFIAYMKRLGDIANVEINSYSNLKEALLNRLKFFVELGCRVSDHAFAYVPYCECDEQTVESIFDKVMSGEAVSETEENQYKTNLLQYLGKCYFEYGLLMQYHIGAVRRNNTKMTKLLGPDTGFDSINDHNIAEPLAKLLDSLNNQGMPKTVLYALNPKDNYTLGTMIGNFAGDAIAGKMQFGSAWWFNDHLDGMELQMKTLANLGLLSQFVGMLTDSRSFTSYPRFEYFRRILCKIIGQWIEDGEIAPDMKRMGQLVEDVCYNNIVRLMN